MNRRSPIQDQHERFLVDEFIRWWAERTGEQFRVILRPHPSPEAIVQSEERITWIEVTDAFCSEAWAQDLYSHATPEEEHKAMGPGPYDRMDQNTADNFIRVVKKKLSKRGYAAPYAQYGPGILLVGMQSPWFDGQTCEIMRDTWERTDWADDRCHFSQVFISFRSMNEQAFEEWKWDAQQNESTLSAGPPKRDSCRSPEDISREWKSSS